MVTYRVLGLYLAAYLKDPTSGQIPRCLFDALKKDKKVKYFSLV